MTYSYPFSNAGEPWLRQVWNKGSIIPGYDSTVWRSDVCGKPMMFGAHGDRNSQYGWEVDHIRPASKGGTDDISNLQPLHWQSNMEKADQWPWRRSS